MMNGMFSIDPSVATRRGILMIAFRGLKPTAKVGRPLRGVRSAVGDRIEAGADLAAKIRETNVLVRVLDAPVRNKYADNIGKRAAWLAAIHVEKAPTSPPTP